MHKVAYLILCVSAYFHPIIINGKVLSMIRLQEATEEEVMAEVMGEDTEKDLVALIQWEAVMEMWELDLWKHLPQAKVPTKR